MKRFFYLVHLKHTTVSHPAELAVGSQLKTPIVASFLAPPPPPADPRSPGQEVDGEVEAAVDNQQQVRDLKQSGNELKYDGLD